MEHFSYLCDQSLDKWLPGFPQCIGPAGLDMRESSVKVRPSVSSSGSELMTFVLGSARSLEQAVFFISYVR